MNNIPIEQMSKLLILYFFVSCFFRVEAQTSSVKIMDMHVNLHLLSEGAKKTRRGVGGCVASDSIVMKVSFKVSDIASCKKVHVYLGTMKDSFDVRDVEVQFAHVDTSHYLNYNGVNNKVENNVAMVLNKFSRKELLKYNYLTLFIEDKKSNSSNTLYFVNK